MSKPDLLIVAPMMPDVMTALERDFQAHRMWEAPDRAAFLKTVGATVRGVATNGGAGLSREVMDALSALEVVVIYGVGLDGIDLTECARRGIVVSNTPDVLTADVADQGLGLLLALARRITYGDRYVRAGHWPQQGEMPLTTRLGGKTAGILGFGRVGQALGRRLEALDMTVAFTDPYPPAGATQKSHPDLHSLAEAADVLIVTAAGGSGTHGMVDAAIFEALGPQGMLINVSRGSIVNEGDLVSALQNGKIAGAALDVFVAEPNVPPKLLTMDNVVLAPHAASGTVETRGEMGQLVLDNLSQYFSAGTLKTPVRLPTA